MIPYRAGGRKVRTSLVVFSSMAVLAIVLGACGGKSDEKDSRGASTSRPGFLPERADTQGAPVAFSPPPERPTPQDEARKTIARYEQELEAEPDSPDTPARLMALGNLYKQKLLDFEQAAYQYRQVTTRFPDFAQVGLAYIELSDCYERLNDWRAAQMVYREMSERFPPDSQEYLYAQQKQNQ